MSNKQAALKIFDAWEESFEAMSASFDILTDDCLLVQAGLPDCTGPKEIQAFLKMARDAGRFETVKVDTLRLVEDGDAVVSERIDYLITKDGKTVATIEVLGIMTFNKDGKISAWREYFDTAATKT